MNPSPSEFVFALTNPGSEKALKLEVAALQPGWRPAYQRRGFVTFKADPPVSLTGIELPLACARRFCLSLGKTTTRSEALALVAAALAPAPAPLIHHARFHERKMQGI